MKFKKPEKVILVWKTTPLFAFLLVLLTMMWFSVCSALNNSTARFHILHVRSLCNKYVCNYCSEQPCRLFRPDKNTGQVYFLLWQSGQAPQFGSNQTGKRTLTESGFSKSTLHLIRIVIFYVWRIKTSRRAPVWPEFERYTALFLSSHI